ncbi:Six-hairpin glycosidase-like protein [Aspergillus recurvatus]
MSSASTIPYVGNGNFAFGADITGLQTLLAFNTLSSWCWCNDSLPTAPNQTDPSDFTGIDWWTHGRLVNYNIQNPAEAEISQWLVANPHRVNLGRVGFLYKGRDISAEDVNDAMQTLDLYSGILTSKFMLHGQRVSVTTVGDPLYDIIAVDVQSPLLKDGSLGVFFDYPLTTGMNKFEAPFVGNWTEKSVIRHTLGNTTYFTTINWGQKGNISGPFERTHRYLLQPTDEANRFTFSTGFSPSAKDQTKQFASVKRASTRWWAQYWESGSFVDLTRSGSSDAEELQRRIILSQYLLAMVFWHLGHWARWNKWDLLHRSLGIYKRFLPSSIERAQKQGYAGARLGKMSDPSGTSAPGSQNAILIWQQPHPMFFAELEYRSWPNATTLHRWSHILDELATWMVSYAWWNASTQVYDLGPPIIASDWKTRQGIPVPEAWTRVLHNLALLPIVDGAYSISADLPDMWTNTAYMADHPSQIAVYGLLPPTAGVDRSIVNATMNRIIETWDFSKSYGWDFPMLAMTALRLGDVNQAVAWLLDSHFQFDDVGNPVGTVVPTPYFPASSALLLAVAMMAGGWDGQEGMHFPEHWGTKVEGFSAGM